MEIDVGKVEAIIDRYQGERGLLIPLLQDIQAELNYLPKEALAKVSEGMEIPLSQVFGVATFFRAFSLKPRGRHVIKVCLGTACHVRGGRQILDKLERDLGISAGQTTDDLEFTLETVNCLGACALGPIVVVNEEYNGQMRLGKVDRLLGKVSREAGR